MVILKLITLACAGDFKVVRLRALRDTPLAFGATYAKESQLSDGDWVKRAEQWSGEGRAGYLAWEGMEGCGIVGGFLDENDPAKANLISMWVSPMHRRRGVGKLLVNKIVEWGQSRNVRTLSLTVTSSNDVAIGFYERLGFVKTGKTEAYPNDAALAEFEMIRSIL